MVRGELWNALIPARCGYAPNRFSYCRRCSSFAWQRRFFRADRLIVEGPVGAEKNVKNTPVKRPVQTFRITGRVSDRNTGHGMASLIVEAVDKDILNEQPLGRATTDAEGRYEITFSSHQIGKGKTGGPDIVVRVFDQKGYALGESARFSNAPSEVRIDLALVPTSGE